MGSVSASESDKATTTTSSALESPPSAPPQLSPWHSPVPYLFGGLAAVICLIMFSLLILAFSYRRHSPRRHQEIGGAAHRKQGDSGMAESVQAHDQKVLVIMAGDQHPTYLATPVVVCTNCSSLGDGFEEVHEKADEKKESRQKTEEQMHDHVATSSTTARPENEGAQ